jgi:acetyl-CoA C-acetyltransferase
VGAFKVRQGSGSISTVDALTAEETTRALAAGAAIADEEIAAGADLLITGDMGIGNTTVAAALVAATLGLDRDSQDQVAYASHERAARAQAEGLFADEIVAVEIPQRKGDPKIFSVDEGVRAETTMDSLGALRPAFDKAGNITAGNASQISDGGSAVIVASEAAAERLGVTPLGRILGYGEVAGPDPSLLNQPANAINVALARAGMSVGDLDLFELNEAFAAVGVASMATLGITADITNVNGGAIALGHPIGMSGNRVALHLLHELKRRGGGRGAAALCGGGGQGDAILLETI